MMTNRIQTDFTRLAFIKALDMKDLEIAKLKQEIKRLNETHNIKVQGKSRF